MITELKKEDSMKQIEQPDIIVKEFQQYVREARKNINRRRRKYR